MPAAEVFSSAGHHDHPDLVIGFRFQKKVVDFGVNPAADGVALARAVHRDRGHTAVLLIPDVLQFHPNLPRWLRCGAAPLDQRCEERRRS